ncbi:MAG: hypothetical protein Q9M91_04305 [Candidatus Dojkabacteria bacterium]|nr:hypothetical protein [Candidatus Dojkabacteria bacterium]MDQ7021035.1 hypothetical protein [Candidatus Dojkabacteria bacterium]
MFILSFSLATPLLAQVDSQPTEEILREENIDAVIDDIPGLRAEFFQKTQDPKSKEIEFGIKLTSRVTSDKVRVTWTLDGKSAFKYPQSSVSVTSIEDGGEYILPITIIPTGQGITELIGKIESFELNNSFVVTVRKNYASNIDGEILPITDEYKSAKTTNLIRTVGIVAVTLIIAAVFATYGLKKFLKWYDRDEVKAFEENKEDRFVSEGGNVVKNS